VIINMGEMQICEIAKEKETYWRADWHHSEMGVHFCEYIVKVHNCMDDTGY